MKRKEFIELLETKRDELRNLLDTEDIDYLKHNFQYMTIISIVVAMNKEIERYKK